MRRRRFGPLRSVALVGGALLLQVTFMPELRVGGATGDLLLTLVVAVALVDGPDRAAGWGFAAGVAYGLLLDTPFGLWALAYTIVGYLVGILGPTTVRPEGWRPVPIAAVAGAAGIGLYAGLANLFGTNHPLDDVVPVVVAVAVWAGLLVIPAMSLVRWTVPDAEPDHVALAFRGTLP